MTKDKDPCLAAGQLRRMIQQRRRDLWWIALFWFVPLLGLITCYYFHAVWWLWALAAVAFASELIQHLADLNQYSHWKKRLAKVEGDQTTGLSS